jgi:hypothetical protein
MTHTAPKMETHWNLWPLPLVVGVVVRVVVLVGNILLVALQENPWENPSHRQLFHLEILLAWIYCPIYIFNFVGLTGIPKSVEFSGAVSAAVSGAISEDQLRKHCMYTRRNQQPQNPQRPQHMVPVGQTSKLDFDLIFDL